MTAHFDEKFFYTISPYRYLETIEIYGKIGVRDVCKIIVHYAFDLRPMYARLSNSFFFERIQDYLEYNLEEEEDIKEFTRENIGQYGSFYFLGSDFGVPFVLVWISSFDFMIKKNEMSFSEKEKTTEIQKAQILGVVFPKIKFVGEKAKVNETSDEDRRPLSLNNLFFIPKRVEKMHQNEEPTISHDDYGYVRKIEKDETLFPITLISLHDFDLSRLYQMDCCSCSTFALWKKREKMNRDVQISEDALDNNFNMCGNVIPDSLYDRIKEKAIF